MVASTGVVVFLRLSIAATLLRRSLAQRGSCLQGLASCTCGIALAQSLFYKSYTNCHALMLLKKTCKSLHILLVLTATHWAGVVDIYSKLRHSSKELLNSCKLLRS